MVSDDMEGVSRGGWTQTPPMPGRAASHAPTYIGRVRKNYLSAAGWALTEAAGRNRRVSRQRLW
jgi:hypothetical protein